MVEFWENSNDFSAVIKLGSAEHATTFRKIRHTMKLRGVYELV
jgi:hypothetical protein